MLLELVEGIVLLFALCFVCNGCLRFWNAATGFTDGLMGVVVGGVCALGMWLPPGVAPGALVDLRSVVLAAVALTMGPWTAVAALAMLLAATGVLHAGVTASDVVLMLGSVCAGLLYRRWHPRGRHSVEVLVLLAFGVALHGLTYSAIHWREMVVAASVQPGRLLPFAVLSGALLALLVWLMQRIQLRHDEEKNREAFVARHRESEQRLYQLLDDLPLISVQGYRPDGTTIYWNKASEQLYGYRKEEALGANLLDLIIPDPMRGGVRKAIATMFATGVPIPASELRLQHKDGRPVDVFSSHAFVQLQGQSPEMFCLDVDLAEFKAAEEKARFLASHDALTQLPNRRWLMEALQQLLDGNARDDKHLAVLMLDLDQFKSINDSLGHEAGDLLLIEMAKRLQACVRKDDLVARLSGDEFVVVLRRLSADSMTAAAEVQTWGGAVLECLRQPVEIGGKVCHPTASMGAVVESTGTIGAAELLKQVELAMYRAKEAGRDTLCFFDPVLQATVDRRVMLQAEMQLALQQEQFTLFLQPQVNAEGATIGAEVLVRWQHPEKGVVAPGEFIPLAEETGQILALGQWVLVTAMRMQAGWQRVPQLAALDLSINISARQFRKDDFLNEMQTLLRETRADPKRIKLELTESLLLQDVDTVITIMHKLRAMGFGISLDDFGTGYSSMSYLKRLPLDQIKIDQGFVRNVLEDNKDAAIAEGIIDLAGRLGLGVIAEGVETEAHHRFLLDHGCREFQGYLFGRPMPLQDFLQRMQVDGA